MLQANRNQRRAAQKIQRSQEKQLPPPGDVLCVYTPITWPFVHKAFFKSFLKVTNLVNIFPLREFGVTAFFSLPLSSFPICRNRNEAVYTAMLSKAKWLMFMDSDMTFPNDVLYQLMKYDKDIISGIYHKTAPPHMPVIYKNKPNGGKCEFTHYVNYPKDKLFEVDLIGMGCVLVKMDVFNHIKMPYFDYQSTREDGVKNVTEDVLFCQKAQEAGYKIWVDPSIQCAHIAQEEKQQQHFNEYMAAFETSERLLQEFGDGIGK